MVALLDKAADRARDRTLAISLAALTAVLVVFAVFAAKQKPDGFFLNDHDRWWEKDPTLVTAYVLNAMNYARPFLK